MVKELNLEQLTRNGFSGGVFLLVVLLKCPRLIGLVPGGALESAVLLAAAALLFGSLIYAVHRAFLYRVMYWAVVDFFDVYSNPRKHRWLIEFEQDCWRLDLQKKNPKDPVADYTFQWGAQVHLLYCSAWAIFLGMIVVVPLRCPLDCWAVIPDVPLIHSFAPISSSCGALATSGIFLGTLVFFGLLLLVAGLRHHYRLLEWIKKYRDQEPQFRGYEFWSNS
jgi:hypothetical protein